MINALNIFLDIFKSPVIFIGLLTILGLILQKKNFTTILSSSIKAMIGMLILNIAVETVVKSVSPLSTIFSKAFNISENSNLVDFAPFLDKYGFSIGMIMLFGFIFNILIARYTKFKTIYLTGNILFWYPMLFLAVGTENKLTGTTLIIFAFIMYMLSITVFPNLLKPHMKYVTGSTDFTIGHTASFFCLLGSYIGKFIGTKENNTERLNIPTSLSSFKDINIVSFLVIFLIYLGFGISIPSAKELFGSNLILFSLNQAILFTASLVILLLGVRMIISEIIPSFAGISNKLCKNSIPALDIPMIFPFGQNSLLLGFIISLILTLLLIFILGVTGFLKVPLLPMVIACYFDIAPACIFANARGGLKAVIITAITCSISLILLLNSTILLVENTVGSFLQIYGGNEFSFWTLIADFIAKLIN